MLLSLVGRCSFEGEILQNTCSESAWGSAGSEMLASGKQLPESFSSPYYAPTCIMLWGCIYSQELSEWPYVRISMHIHLVNVAYLLLQAINRTINRKGCLHARVTTSEHTHVHVHLSPSWGSTLQTSPHFTVQTNSLIYTPGFLL